MDVAQYVSNVGKQINDSTKTNIETDKESIVNIVLVDHLENVYNHLELDLADNNFDFPFTREDLAKIGGYINCLKKEINFYEVKDIDDDCILTEVEEHIIQE